MQRGAGLFAACARRADFAVPRGARLLAADAKAGEPDAAAAAAAAAAAESVKRFVEAAKLKTHADKFKTVDELLSKRRLALKEAGLTPREVRAAAAPHRGNANPDAAFCSASGSCGSLSSIGKACSSREPCEYNAPTRSFAFVLGAGAAARAPGTPRQSFEPSSSLSRRAQRASKRLCVASFRARRCGLRLCRCPSACTRLPACVARAEGRWYAPPPSRGAMRKGVSLRRRCVVRDAR